MGWGGVLWGPKGWGWSEKVFSVMRSGVGQGWCKTKSCGTGRRPYPSPHPAPLPLIVFCTIAEAEYKNF